MLTAVPPNACQSLPRTMRSLYCHAWQSLVWNKAATRRVERYGADQVVPGDLVLVSGGEGTGGEEAGEEAVTAPSEEGTGEGEEEEEETSGEGPALKGEDEVEAEAGADSRVHVVTESDVAAQRYAVTDVVLPIPGYASVLPHHEVKEVYEVRPRARAHSVQRRAGPPDFRRLSRRPRCSQTLMDRDGIDRAALRDVARQMHLPGAYRRLICRPSELEWELCSYSDESVRSGPRGRVSLVQPVLTRSQAPLQLSDLDRLEGKSLPAPESEAGAWRALRISFQLRTRRIHPLPFPCSGLLPHSAAPQHRARTRRWPCESSPGAAPRSCSMGTSSKHRALRRSPPRPQHPLPRRRMVRARSRVDRSRRPSSRDAVRRRKPRPTPSPSCTRCRAIVATMDSDHSHA